MWTVWQVVANSLEGTVIERAEILRNLDEDLQGWLTSGGMCEAVSTTELATPGRNLALVAAN